MPGNYLLGGWWGTTLWSTVLFLQRYQGEEEVKHRRQSQKDHQLVEIGGGRGYQKEGGTVQLLGWSSARCGEHKEEMDQGRTQNENWEGRVEQTGDKVRISKPSVASERNFHILVRKMPRFQTLIGIKLNGQTVSPRVLPVFQYWHCYHEPLYLIFFFFLPWVLGMKCMSSYL